MQDADLETRTQQIGRELLARAHRRPLAIMNGWLQRAMMNWGLSDDRVKSQVFRFVDVLPVLSSAPAVNAHLQEYLAPVRGQLPSVARELLDRVPREGFLGRVGARGVGWGARAMARRFIAASNLSDALTAVRRLRGQGLGFTIDLLGEAVVSDLEATQYQRGYLEIMEGLTAQARRWLPQPAIDQSPWGPLPRVNISIKLSSLDSQFDPIDPEGSSQSVRERLRPILRRAQSLGAFVNIDMEQYAFKNLTLQIFRQILNEPEFSRWSNVGVVLQAYLRDSGHDLAALAEWARQRGTPVWVRLVKGAYWDFESVVSAQNNWPLPVFDHKSETDANFEAQAEFLIDHARWLRPAIASHNVRSLARAMALAESRDLPVGAIEYQMLYGMADEIKAALVAMGQRVRVYTPFGQLLPGMAYLVRRLLENTSNESFLRASLEHLPEERLLMNPAAIQPPMGVPKSPHDEDISPGNGACFRNEPLSDFSRQSERTAMRAALEEVRQALGKKYPLIIGGREIFTDLLIESVDPAHQGRMVGQVASASAGHAANAIEAAYSAFPGWRDTSVARRAELLVRTAGILRERRYELAAWEVFETGKQWREADADVAEAIDYCLYYSAEMRRLDHSIDRNVPGEQNETFYEPRGVTVTIAPWNFPLAILCGMTTAALAGGNTVVMKPAEQSPVVAAELMSAFQDSGFPAGVVNFLPGMGETVGPALVQHPRVSVVAFTGSRAVGLNIATQAAQVLQDQDHLKRVIVEMGGKNAIIIDSDADLDEAVHGVIASAFGYAGQKCSACSRAIVVSTLYQSFLNRLVEAARSLRTGPPEDPTFTLGPVIDEEARRRIWAYVETGKKESRLAYAADLGSLADEGTYVPLHIFADVPPAAVIAQEEIFGPVLSVIRATDLEEALRIANDTRYALTGGLYSRSPANVERVRREFRVGNLYINRKITGALVDRQPFGGFKLSGGGTKAGGRDYLLNFLVPRTITENTLRHGFAPARAGSAGDASAGE